MWLYHQLVDIREILGKPELLSSASLDDTRATLASVDEAQAQAEAVGTDAAA
jgi:hypothetical protein